MERPEIMADETLRLRRLLEGFGKSSQKADHLHHRGKVRSVGDEKAPAFEIYCECGTLLGPWRDV